MRTTGVRSTVGLATADRATDVSRGASEHERGGAEQREQHGICDDYIERRRTDRRSGIRVGRSMRRRSIYRRVSQPVPDWVRASHVASEHSCASTADAPFPRTDIPIMAPSLPISARHTGLLVALALVLATINQVFSLLDPLIFRHVIDDYATKHDQYTNGEFFRGVTLLLAMAVGVAFVSRVAKNFQDYFVNVVTQRLGAQLYSDGIRHSLSLPFQVFEDQRSGETLGKLQKVRADTEKFIAAFVNMVFTTLVGVIFVMIYAYKVHWSIAPAFLLTIPLLGGLSSVLSRRIKTIQKVIVAETTALAGATTESLRNIELVKSLGLVRAGSRCGSTRRPTRSSSSSSRRSATSAA